MKRVMAVVAVAALVLAFVGEAVAQNQNPRFGRWRLKSDAPAPSSNVMTYEPHGDKGMKVTVESVNAKGEKTTWWYTTDFDGKDMPVTGQDNSTSAVMRIDDKINKIVNKRNGRVRQTLVNVLSTDNDTIGVMYMNDDGTGKITNITVATYERIK
jgi:hypothetical protein